MDHKRHGMGWHTLKTDGMHIHAQSSSSTIISTSLSIGVGVGVVGGGGVSAKTYNCLDLKSRGQRRHQRKK